MFLVLWLSLFSASASSSSHYDVIVVGAGPAGLNATRILKENGLNVLCLEARSRVGGRVYSQPIGDGQHIELGAQWMAKEGHSRLEGLVKEYGLTPSTHKKVGKDIAITSSGIHRVWGGRDLSLLGQLDTLHVYLQLKRVLKRVQVSEPWRSPDLDQISAYDWIRQVAWSEENRAFWTNVIEQEMCCDSRAVSLLEVAQNMLTAGEIERLESADHYFFSEGLSTVFNKMANELGGSVKTNEPVVSLRQSDSAVEVVTGKGSYLAKHVILAIPPQLLAALGVGRPIEEMSRKFLEGRVLKMIAVYDSPWWRDRGFSGKTFSKDGLVDGTADSSVSESARGILVGFVSGPRASAMLTLSNEERQQVFQAHIERGFGRGPKPVQFFAHDWNSDEYSHGGYASRRGLGEWTRSEGILQDGIGRILFAGTESANEWRGFIEGALESGERAADQCQRYLKSQIQIKN